MLWIRCLSALCCLCLTRLHHFFRRCVEGYPAASRCCRIYFLSCSGRKRHCGREPARSVPSNLQPAFLCLAGASKAEQSNSSKKQCTHVCTSLSEEYYIILFIVCQLCRGEDLAKNTFSRQSLQKVSRPCSRDPACSLGAPRSLSRLPPSKNSNRPEIYSGLNMFWCRGEDLNLHELPRLLLRQVRLPFRHPGEYYDFIT